MHDEFEVVVRGDCLLKLRFLEVVVKEGAQNIFKVLAPQDQDSLVF